MLGRALFGGARELRESVTTLAGPAEWLVDALGATKSASGIRVDEQSALKLAAVSACVRVVSETVAGLPAIIYERESENARVRADYDPWSAALRIAPNPEMTAFEYWENVTAYGMLWARTWSYILRRRNGTVELWPLPPNRCTLAREAIPSGSPGKPPLPGPITGLNVSLDNGEVRFVPWRSIVGFRAFGYASKTPIERHRETIGLGLAAEEFGARFFGQGGTAGGFISMPQEATPEQADRSEARFRAKHEGLDRAHLVGVLEGGAQWVDVGMPLKDAEYIDGRQFTVEEVARIFRVPPHKIGDLRRSTFSNIEHQAIEFVTDSIGPWLSRHEQAMRAYLFGTQRYGRPGDRWAEFLVEHLLRGDIETRYRAYSVAIQYGFLTRNEVRELENRRSLDELDKPLYPVNLAVVGEAAGDDALDPDDPEVQRFAKLGALLGRSFRNNSGGVALYEPDALVESMRARANGHRPSDDRPTLPTGGNE